MQLKKNSGPESSIDAEREETVEDHAAPENMDEPTTVPEPEVTITTTPEVIPVSTPAPTPAPTPTPMFDIIDGETIMLSITEEEFIEYADFLRRELNLNDAALAGVLSNLQGESSFNPKKVGDMGSAYGLCQWRGERLNQMIAYCEEHDLNPILRDSQLQFLAYDLQYNYIYAYDLVRMCPDSEDGALQATFYFCAYYEVPADPETESVERERLTKLLIFPRLKELSEEEG